jgi:hypothetical protein
VKAHQLILGTKGRVVVTGMGKSGHIGYKIASTLASTGTPRLLHAPGRGKPRRPGHDHRARHRDRDLVFR